MRTYNRNFHGRAIGFGFIGLVGLVAFTALVMVLWNWLVPTLFTGPVITFWQAGGVLLLSKVLFSGFWGHGHRTSDYRHSAWRRRFEKKMKTMSEEEKEQFKEKFRHRFFRHDPYFQDEEEEKKNQENQE